MLYEVEDNLSYCYAVKGVLIYNRGEKLAAANLFEKAYIHNVSGLTSRIFNFGCASALRYAKNKKEVDLNRVVECFVELAQYSEERERFVNDDDVKYSGVKSAMDKILRARGQESLIVPDPEN